MAMELNPRTQAVLEAVAWHTVAIVPDAGVELATGVCILGQPVALQKMADVLRAYKQSPAHRAWVQAAKMYLLARYRQPDGKRS